MDLSSDRRLTRKPIRIKIGSSEGFPVSSATFVAKRVAVVCFANAALNRTADTSLKLRSIVHR